MMTEELPLFDLPAGQARRDVGAAAALNGDALSLALWRSAARASLTKLAHRGWEFSADDLVADIGPPPIGRHNALGGLFLWAVREGLVRPAGFHAAQRPSAHARIQRTWIGERNLP
jgi:hypothetical protein